MCPHRSSDPGPSVQLQETAERVCHALERQGVRHDPAPVDRGRNRRGVDIGSRGDLCQHQPLARVIGEAVTGARPTARATECKETSVLA